MTRLARSAPILACFAMSIAAGCSTATTPVDIGTDASAYDLPASDAIADAAPDTVGDVSQDGPSQDDLVAQADAATDVPTGPVNFRVMSFNVMCPFCDDTFDKWEDRLTYFKDVFSRHHPDLIGIQEPFEPKDVDSVLGVAPGYAAVYYAGDAQWPAYPDATLLYLKDRFEVLETGSYWLSPTPEDPWSMGFADGQVIPRIVIWARMRDKTSGRAFYFANTHFDSTDPHQEKSAPLVLERVAPWAAKLPVIHTGDFNSEPFHPAYKILTGGVDGKGFKLQDAFVLSPAWHVDANREPAPDYDPAVRIDHVFVAGGDWSCTDWRADLCEYGAKKMFPSDHRAIVADLVLR